MGSRTFRDMMAYWPSSTEPYAAPMNDIPKVVFSRSRSSPTLRLLVHPTAVGRGLPSAAMT